MSNASLGLIWVGVIGLAMGAIIGLVPTGMCGSAWLPQICEPGMNVSAAIVSGCFILVSGAAFIAGLLTSK